MIVLISKEVFRLSKHMSKLLCEFRSDILYGRAQNGFIAAVTAEIAPQSRVALGSL